MKKTIAILAFFAMFYGFGIQLASAQAPTISYSGPNSYTTTTAITPLAPTSSGVCAPGYNATDTIGAEWFNDPTVISPGGSNYRPNGIAVDASGNVYVAAWENGLVEIPAGNGTPDPLSWSLSSVLNVLDVAVDLTGNIYYSLYNAGDNYYRIWERKTDGTDVQLVGNAGGPGTGTSLAVDPSGNLYYNDGSQGITKLKADGSGTIALTNYGLQAVSIAVDGMENLYFTNGSDSNVHELLAGTSTLQSIGSGFISPLGVAVDGSGNFLYVTDTGDNTVKMIEKSTQQVTTIASGFTLPSKLAVDGSGNVYVSDNNSVIKEIIPTLPGTLGSGFNHVSGVAVDGTGNIYVADNSGNAIKKIPAGNGTPVTIGPAFNNPLGVAVDAAGNVYVADTGNDAVKEILAGTSTAKILGSGFKQPWGVAVDAAGNVYVCRYG